MAFIDAQRAEGHAVESTCQVLREQGCRVACTNLPGVEARPTVALASMPRDGRDHRHGRHPGRAVRAPEDDSYLRRRATRSPTTPPTGSLENPGQERDPTRQRPRTTIPAKDGTRVGDLLNRTSPRRHSNRVWVADSPTYRSGRPVFVPFVVDVLAQRIVAWHGATDSARSWCWSRSGWRRGTATGTGHPVVAGELVHHHDAGSQYTSLRFAEHLARSVRALIGTVGDAYDIGSMESIIGLFKTECIGTDVLHARPFRTLADIEYATAGWVDWWNNRRSHGTLRCAFPGSRAGPLRCPHHDGVAV